MFINAKEMKNHINQIMSNDLIEDTSSELPHVSNAGFNKYGNYWATAIAIDIRGFKNIVNHYSTEKTVKLIQAFTSSLMKILKKNKNYRFSTASGDSVIGMLAAPKKSDVDLNVETAILCNSFANVLFPKILKQHGINDFKAGIGVWTSNDNAIIGYGERNAVNESLKTAIGSSINWSSFLSKQALKNSDKQILFNNITFTNCSKEHFKSNAIIYSQNINGELIRGSNFRFVEYEKE